MYLVFCGHVCAQVLFFSDAGQATIDGSLEPGGRAEGSLATARALAADVDSGFGLLVNGGDLVQSECATWSWTYISFTSAHVLDGYESV